MSAFPTAALPDNRIREKISPMPAVMQRMLGDRTYFIFNVGPYQWERTAGAAGKLFIPACPEGEPVSHALFYEGKPGIPELIPEQVIDQVEGRTVTKKWDFSTEGREVVKQILGTANFMDKSDDLRKFGVFLAAGPVPTDQEIEAATDAWHETCSERVREADQAYEINGGMVTGDDGRSRSSITKDHILAAKVLGVDKPWSKRQKAQVPCPACERPVGPTAVRCHHEGCGAILNEEKARKLFPHLYAEEAKRGPGRPRNPEAAA